MPGSSIGTKHLSKIFFKVNEISEIFLEKYKILYKSYTRLFDTQEVHNDRSAFDDSANGRANHRKDPNTARTPKGP